MGRFTRGHLLAALIAVVAVVALVTVTLVAVSPDSSRSAEKPRVKPVYVAMGSSFASGVGDGKDINKPCSRTKNNYPHRLAKKAHLKLTDVTCAGATTRNILEPDPEHPDRPVQINAVTPKTQLVTITVGGNDIAYVPRTGTASCANILTGQVPSEPNPHCERLVWPSPFPTPESYQHVEQSMIDVVHQIHALAPKAKVLLVEYLPVVSPDAPPCPALPLEPWQVVETAQVGDQLSQATQRAAAASGATFVSMSEGKDHTVCSKQPWVRGYGDRIPYHPNPAGNQAVADRVAQELAKDPVTTDG
ncbi:MAG: SGNH/GDSL hydrolase family protein [Gordonia sp. (in: high G+C Gram-positive bacteria)]|uniref:SGNH/GDSL hydrolase family protein n=1 Tax=Gordonia sp. (in: high G+C Gram-positive bacteria) TaxID=84139 RepID=UPI0039E6A6C9